MEYRNKKTGFVFESDCTCSGEDWETLSPKPDVAPVQPAENEDKPKKRTKKS